MGKYARVLKERDIVMVSGIFELLKTKHRKETTTISYTHLAPTERGQIQAFLTQGCSFTEIANELKRNVSKLAKNVATGKPIPLWVKDSAVSSSPSSSVNFACCAPSRLGVNMPVTSRKPSSRV